MAHGLTVGTYTSPHLERVNERIARNGEPIDDDDFAEQIAAVADLEGITGVRPSYFEACTAAAFRWFADVAVDVVVAEVGLLGRWDATNVLDAQVAVVTNIGMDHTEFAGPTLADIAAREGGNHQAGLGGGHRRDRTTSSSAILDAEPAASRLHRGDDFDVVGNQLAVGGRSSICARRPPCTRTCSSRCTAPTSRTTRRSPSPPSRRSSPPRSPPTSSPRGLAAVVMPGRFEVMAHQPLVIVDGAHNPPGADTCAQVFFDDFDPEGRRFLVVGTLRDPEAMLAALRADEFDIVIAATAPSPRGVPADRRRRCGRRRRM